MVSVQLPDLTTDNVCALESGPSSLLKTKQITYYVWLNEAVSFI